MPAAVRRLLDPNPDPTSWTFDAFREVLAALPPDLHEEDVFRDDLLLFDDGRVSLFYAPFDHINAAAKVVLVGITPGRYQFWRALTVARDGLQAGRPDADVVRRVKEAASFSGPMRKNLVTMLDGIGLAQALRIGTTATLFEADAHLLFSTSAVSFPVFVRGRNYTGSTPHLLKHPVLRQVAERVFAERVVRVPEALIIPLGKVASQVVEHLALQGKLDRRRCLFGFPHPSGGNGHRVREFNENRAVLTQAVREWFGLG